MIAKDLIHPNIVEYKYFMKKFDTENNNYEFHIIMELLEGQDMDSYIKKNGRPLEIGLVRNVA